MARILTNEKFWEEYRLVDPDAPASLAIQEIGETTAKLLYPNHDFSTHPVRFLLFDDDNVNAFFLAKGNKGAETDIIAFSKGLIALCPTLDCLVGVNFHELTHLGIRNDLGKNSKSYLEERVSDNRAVRGLYDAGFDPRGYMELFSLLIENRPGSQLAEALSLHGTRTSRLEDIKAQLVMLGAGVAERVQRPIAVC